eukprot:768247-Hanusia_phi.AAC.2
MSLQISKARGLSSPPRCRIQRAEVKPDGHQASKGGCEARRPSASAAHADDAQRKANLRRYQSGKTAADGSDGSRSRREACQVSDQFEQVERL